MLPRSPWLDRSSSSNPRPRRPPSGSSSARTSRWPPATGTCATSTGKGIAVDRSRNYEPNYRIGPGKERTVADLARLAKKAERIYLAADPDREGEANCWHLHELLKKEAPKARFHRAEFHEITKSAVTRAIEKPGKISKDRVPGAAAEYRALLELDLPERVRAKVKWALDQLQVEAPHD